MSTIGDVAEQQKIAGSLLALSITTWPQLEALDEGLWQELVRHLRTQLLYCAEMEIALTQIRKMLLAQYKVLPRQGRALELLGSLGPFCDACEFVLHESAAESAIIAQLDPDRSVIEHLLIACYRPIHAEPLPIDEVQSLGSINDPISRQVQLMYEENPYPRWRDFDVARVLPDENAQRILVAGCGSGREPIMRAANSPRSSVIGIDLSRTSLAYGLMKAREYRVQNLKLLQLDILEVHLLKQQFDLITCVGALHHMGDPLAGLTALKGVLAPEGQLRLHVYSSRARRSILEAIELRKQCDALPTAQGIKEFRQKILALPKTASAKGVLAFTDFFSVSGARDLLFHVQEHNYSIRSLLNLVEQANLRIVNFVASEKAMARYRAAGNEDPLDMQAWATLEDVHPSLFGAMYRIHLRH